MVLKELLTIFLILCVLRAPRGKHGKAMKYRLLDFLVCPDCSGELNLNVFKEERVEYSSPMVVKACNHSCALKDYLRKGESEEIDCNDCCRFEIKEGVLQCKHDHIFPIVNYIPKMLPDAFCDLEMFLDEYKHLLPMERIKERVEGKEVGKFIRIQKSTRESFEYEWLRYDVNLEEEDREIFLRDSQITEESFKGKMILDAGCGMGRYTRIAGDMGGEIVGVDLSQSILKAYQITRDNPFAHIIQGDILHLPFSEKKFDIIYSLGVLHHTPSAKEAFLNLTKFLRKGGFISIWVYGTAGKFHDFKSNPLGEERQRYTKSNMAKRLHWVIVYVREIVFKTVRLVTTKMYVPLLYLLCYPLVAIGKIPFLKYLTASVHKNWRVRLQENFDWFSPQYQSHHTKEEVLGWFRKAELDDISILKHGFIPKVGLRGKLK